MNLENAESLTEASTLSADNISNGTIGIDHVVVESIDDDTWWDYAACKGVDTELFFPVSTDPQDSLAAKAVCDMCVVKIPCLNYALVNHISSGIWGGMSELERKGIAKQRRSSNSHQ